jgi:hypothetical protein
VSRVTTAAQEDAVAEHAGNAASAFPSAPANALVLRRQGVSLSPDGKRLVLEAPPSSLEEAVRAGIFRRMPEAALPQQPGGESP